MPGLKTEVRHEPLGVVAHIGAWNAPLLDACDFLVPCLLSGNGVMYKPSEYSTLSCLKLLELFYEAGVPRDILQCCLGGAGIGEAILSLPIAAVSFIGSAVAGSKVAVQSAKQLIPVNLSLGGKDTFVVLADADLKQAVERLARGAFEHAGQHCYSVERIYVEDAVYDDFLEMFVARVKCFKHTDMYDEENILGPLVRKSQLDVIEHQVADARSRGATVALGGCKHVSDSEHKELNLTGYYYEPTILTNVDIGMEVMRTETCGPVVCISHLSPDCLDEQIVQLCNESDYGLTGGVFSKNALRARNIMSQMHVGTTYWNTCSLIEPSLPWSGRKLSGLGFSNGIDLRHNFTAPKSVYLYDTESDEETTPTSQDTV
jgi:acyl-CoA reductase-like NAD-dependent aldehyde dehydrogenase